MSQMSARKPVCLITLLITLAQLAGLQPSAHAAPGPDLSIFRLAFEPEDPIFLSPVSVEVGVENAGSAADETVVTLQWCCGEVSRSLGGLEEGETASVVFAHSLVFPEPGEYEITAVVDPDGLVTEDDEANNTMTETLTVRLRAEPSVPAEAAGWGSEGTQLACPETELMGIGRREPYAVEDLCPDAWAGDDPDGCPRIDVDGDTVYEGDPAWHDADECPLEPGPGDNGGCPPEGDAADQDGDGFPDSADPCPEEWSPPEYGGCPRPDRDGDGTPDNVDTCPDEPGPGGAGCPIAGEEGDTDGDGAREDAISRMMDLCELQDDQTDDRGCQVYLRGQRVNACGTTSLAYTLRYLGGECCGEACAPDCIDDDIRCYTGTDMFSDPISLEEYAEERGFNAEIFINGDLDEVRWFVERGVPVLLQIANTAGSIDVNDGHWVVVTSFCEIAQEYPAGTTETVISIYDPGGFQFTIAPDRLLEFWGKMVYPVGKADVPLWTRLYIPVSDQSLPSGNSDEVRSQLALAQGLSTFMTGGQDFADIFEEGEIHRALEGVVELGGGVATTIMAFVSMMFTWGGDIPLVGGMLDSLGDMAGDLTLVGQDLVNALGDLLNPENWFDPERMGQILGDFFKAIGEGIVAIFEGVWDFIVDGIGGFFKSLWEGIKKLGCSWFGVGCPKKVIYYKHYASSDPCLESGVFINGLARIRALGYIYGYQAPGTSPLYLFAAADSATTRVYHLCDDPTWSRADAQDVMVGVVGYTLDVQPGADSLDVKTAARNYELLCDESASLGYLPSVVSATTTIEGTGILWLMKALENEAFTVSTDQCAGTQTFVTSVVEGYTRELVVGYLPPSETDGATKLYRLFNGESDDCMLTTEVPPLGSFTLDFQEGDGLAVGDVDGDAVGEIVHGDRDNWIRVYDGQGVLLSEFGLNYEAHDGLAVGDVNGDGSGEIIHGDRDDRIQVFDADGNRLSVFELDFDEGDGLAAGDVNGDGVDEIVHGDRSDYIRVLDIDGERLSVFDLNYERHDGLAVGDVTGDGVAEIVHGDRDDRIRVMDITGERLSVLERDFEGGDGLAVGDVNGDGVGEIIHGDRDDRLRVLAMDGTVLEDHEIDFEGHDGLAAGDVTGDGIDEIVHGDRDNKVQLNPKFEGYANQGYLGHIYTEEQPGTVPLYQFYNSRRKDHMVTLDSSEEPEGLSGYSDRELLGYVLPPTEIEPDDLRCNLPLWRFCKRILRKE
jgi:hypothetical protein